MTLATRLRSSAVLEVTRTAVGSLASLESDWRSVESSGRSSFFQSWDWIGSLLEALPAAVQPSVLRVFSDRRLVALGLLWRGTQQRHGFVRSRTLHLNETGLADFDRITLEHNGLVTAEGFEVLAVNAVVGHLSQQDDWDELYLAGLASPTHTDWSRAARTSHLWVHTRWEKPFYYIDLEQIRSAGHSYLAVLSANTRYQARRAMKLYSSRGDLRFEQASSIEEARDWFSKLAALHQRYWIAKGQEGAFCTDFVLRFHATLISRGWPNGSVKVARVLVGTDALGYIYNFFQNGVLYNYQAGHVSEDASKLKPGLVCHSLAAEDAVQRGYAVYDLMMGGGHFKPGLTNATGSMVWSVIQKKRLAIGIENVLRRSRDNWRSGARSRGSEGAAIHASLTDEPLELHPAHKSK